ncbi:hypothetical protein PIB30_043681 [Stylosanthes scabra]|uniref:Uncharacterized protein n=1 Tax=Stylosanthes scabra TaxID=79078 RepID=A0ABU6QFL4_9FABA|nr:hypothetical protein [Stylosanthes scabra]
MSEQLLPIGFPQHPRERFEVRLHAPHLMARQLGFTQVTPAHLSMVEAEQAHQLKIDSLDSLLAALSSNEDRKQQYKPFDCVPCTIVTRAFNVWWTSYFKKIIRPFDAVGADKLLAKDQPQRPKPAPKRKTDPTSTSKKTTKKTKIKKTSVSSKASKTKRSTVPPTRTSQIIPPPPPEPSNVQFDASSGTKVSEGDVPPPKASDPKETQPTPLPTYLVSSDSASMHSQQISPISRRPKSPEVISKEAKEKTQINDIKKDSHASSSDTNTEIGPQLNTAEKAKSLPKPNSSHDSGDFLLDIESLVAELHKAASETVVEKTGHSDSLNKSVQQEVNRYIEEPIMDRSLTPVNQYCISAEVLNALRWLIDLLNASLEQDVDHEMVQQIVELVTSHFHKHYVLEEAAPIEGVPLLVKNLVNTASNLKKCQNRVVDLGKDLKLLDKTTSDYDKVKSQLSIEVDSANDKLLELNQQKLKHEKELASI